jgi:ATP-binding cassette subfamily C (CFTR/MRP) protein 1
VHLLSFADCIVALGDSGSIAEVGSFNELRSQNGYVGSLDIASRTENAPPLLVEDGADYRFDRQKVAKESTDTARQIGDNEVYMYYFRSNGLWNMIIYLALQISWATMGNFPSM